MNFCFIMDRWESINYGSDSTICMIHEAVSRNHNVGILHNDDLTMYNNVTYGHVRMITSSVKKGSKPSDFARKITFNEVDVPLSGFDVIFLRSDPPMDEIALSFLDSIKHETFILNDIDGLRKANNKLYPASFHTNNSPIVPTTHVSRNKDYLYDLILKSKEEKMILKPLNSFGGNGVIVVEKKYHQSVRSLLDFYITGPNGSNYVILQDFVPGVEDGDIRIILLNGKPIGAVKRIPATGEFRSNSGTGATACKHKLTKAEEAICKSIGDKLVEDGIYIAGLDIINNTIIEINVVSPGGIHVINKFDKTNLQKKIIDFAENVIDKRHKTLRRKYEYQKLVRNA